jgi:hypothetical protein
MPCKIFVLFIMLIKQLVMQFYSFFNNKLIENIYLVQLIGIKYVITTWIMMQLSGFLRPKPTVSVIIISRRTLQIYLKLTLFIFTCCIFCRKRCCIVRPALFISIRMLSCWIWTIHIKIFTVSWNIIIILL